MHAEHVAKLELLQSTQLGRNYTATAFAMHYARIYGDAGPMQRIAFANKNEIERSNAISISTKMWKVDIIQSHIKMIYA